MSGVLEETNRLFELYTQDHNVAHLEEIFNLIDKDHSGEITRQEAADLFRPLVGKDADFIAVQFIAEGDTNGDQKISLAEFIGHFTKQS